MLEDDFTYVIRKAFKGLALSPSEAASRAGLPETDVLAFSRGKFSAATARQLAPALGLKPEALASHDSYEPAAIGENAIHRLVLPFGGDHVNAWLVSKDGVSLLFDTGDDPHSAAKQLDQLDVPKLDAIFITHHHHDHIAGLPGLTARSARVFNDPSAAGGTHHFGDLKITAIDLSGHAIPALGFLIAGLAKPVFIAGDAIFAGSIGGCPDEAAYQLALRNIRQAIADLPDETILLPGHGPATTLGQERERNPFF